MSKCKVTCKKCGSSDVSADFSGSMDASDYHNGVQVKTGNIGEVNFFCYDCEEDFAEVDVQEISVEAQEK